MKKPTTRRRRGLIAVGAGLLAAAITAVVIYAFSGPTTPPDEQDPMPPVAQGPLTDTDLQQVKSVLGPFKAIAADADRLLAGLRDIVRAVAAGDGVDGHLLGLALLREGGFHFAGQ